MVLIAATLALVVCQDPQPQTPPRPTEVPAEVPAQEADQGASPGTTPDTATAVPAAPAPPDVVKLVGGEEITGTILKQVGNYIEVRLGEGTVVGFERSRVVAIRRGTAAPKAAGPKPSVGLQARDDWFLLHDAKGMSVGYLHALVQADSDGSFRFNEEWYFNSSKGRTQVTILENTDAQLRPVRSFYHERVVSKSERLVGERLLTAEVAGRSLVVRRRSLKGRSRSKYTMRDDVQFPLAYRERLRQASGTVVLDANQELFDARSGEFRTWHAQGAVWRKVQLQGQTVRVREVTLNDGDTSNAEWIDGHQKVVRREVNGPSLVAIPTTKERALRAAVDRGEVGVDSAIAATGSGSMALWIPNPIWRIGRVGAGSLTLDAPLYDASVALLHLDQIDANVQLESAADQVVRWLRLTVGRKIEVRKRERMQVQRAPAIRLTVEWSVEREGESRPWKGVCHVIYNGDRYAALFCAAPLRNFDVLDGDFRRILASVQLDHQDIDPVQQGPLARPRR